MTDASEELSLVGHLLELRQRLVRSSVALLLCWLVLFPFAGELYSFIAAPLLAQLPEHSGMIATGVFSPFLAPFKFSFLLAILIVLPYVLHQIWAFVSPGLYRHEKALAIPLLVASVVLFYCGAAFAYFVVFPLVFGFVTSVAPQGVTVMPDITSYLDFVIVMFLSFGAAFEVPVLTMLLVLSGIVTTQELGKMRPYVIVGAFVVGMLLTPPDVISQVMMAVPMWLLFELGLLLSRVVQYRAGQGVGRKHPDLS